MLYFKERENRTYLGCLGTREIRLQAVGFNQSINLDKNYRLKKRLRKRYLIINIETFLSGLVWSKIVNVTSRSFATLSSLFIIS